MQHKTERPALFVLFLSYAGGSVLLGWLLNYVFYGRMPWAFYIVCGGLFAALMTGIEWYRRNSHWKR